MNISIINRRDIILNVRDKWLGQYKHYKDDYHVGWGDQMPAGEIRKRLAALDLETCSPTDVDKALQSKNWASNECDLCGEDKEQLIRIGEEPDYEARWVDICSECASKAASALPLK